ncbi:MAG: TolC family outer membrane protein [Desulfobacterales bacterium]|nr:TolC family outer membrane protein [Desulfobacterales bacterium]
MGKKSLVLQTCFILILVSSFFIIPTHASETIRLDEALGNVIGTNPLIQESVEAYKSIVAERKVAKKGYRPTIGIEAYSGPKYTNGVPTNHVSDKLWENSATAYLRQNLFEGFGTQAYVDETEARIKSAAYHSLNVANDVVLEVALAYVNVLNAREQVGIAQKNVLTQARILKQIKERADSGFGRASDLTNAESRLALSRGNFISRQQDLNQALTKFHRASGRIFTPDQFSMPEIWLTLPETVQEAVDIAFKTHPALRVAQYNIIVRKYSRDRAKSTFWPSIDLYLSSNIRRDTNGERGETKELGAALQLNYLLYDGGARYGEVKKNYRYMLKEYQKAYDERRNVNEMVRLSWNILVAEKNKRDFLAEHVKLSEKTLNEFIQEFHAGKRDLLEILDMEIEFYTARSAQIESQFAYLSAYFRTVQAMGALLSVFDSNLVDTVGVPQDKTADARTCASLAEFVKVKGLMADRDDDATDDCGDQCDNSEEGAELEGYGCANIDPSESGYQVPDELAPYIIE